MKLEIIQSILGGQVNNILKLIEQRIAVIKQVICEQEAALSKAPEGTLNIAGSKDNPYYYYKKTSSDQSKKYLKASEKQLVEALCQKEYNQKVLQSAKKELYQLERLKKGYPNPAYDEVYEKIHPQRQKLVHPIVVPDEEFVKQWEQFEYIKKDFRDDAPEYYTDKGERVRSKTEILIANALTKHDIPYRYEAPLYLNGHGTIHPDFTVLNVRLRKEFYWEHMGMMDDFEYVEAALLRIEMYEKNDIFPGNKLILTHETARRPINSRNIEKMIFQYLK